MEDKIVLFELAGEHYGVDIHAVEGIIQMQAIAPVPNTPAFVEGVTNLRGEVLPVVDLRKRFGLPESPITKDTRIVVAEVEQGKVGLIVDAVNEVLRLPAEAVEPASRLMATLDSASVIGIAKLSDRLVILLDLAEALRAEEPKALDAVDDQS